jgi:hypothetical protein
MIRVSVSKIKKMTLYEAYVMPHIIVLGLHKVKNRNQKNIKISELEKSRALDASQILKTNHNRQTLKH